MASPVIIAVAGGSGSGKSTFVQQLAEALREQSVKVCFVSTDSYFKHPLPKMISPLTGQEYEDWNSPESIDSAAFIAEVKAYAAGEKEADILLVEGLSVLYFSELLPLYHLKVFVELDSDLRMYRRIKRNMANWGVSMEEVADYYLEAAKFGEEKYFLPTKRQADLILNGASDFTKSTELLAAWVQSKR